MDLLEVPSRPVRRHPWEAARFEFFFRVLAASLDVDALATVLDVGAGDGWFAERLSERIGARRIVCWDTAYTPDLLADRRFSAPSGVELSTKRPAGRFDLLLLLDVLEHVEDDRAFLDDLVRENLASGGRVLISVPAWPCLFSSHDVRLRHYRRYTPRSARTVLRGARLEIIRSAGLFHSLLLPRALHVARAHVTNDSRPPAHVGEWNAPAIVTTLVARALACDSSISLAQSKLGWSLPGLSWWALCRKASVAV
jgi:trans-aconitate methyltransferase